MAFKRVAPECERNAWLGVECKERSLKQNTPVGAEEQVGKLLRFLYRNDLRMLIGLSDILTEKEGETNKDFWKMVEFLFLLAVSNESHGMFMDTALL